MTAFDFASHKGNYSIELARHFKSVCGFEIRDTSREAAELVTKVLGVDNVRYVEADLQEMPFEPDNTVDFVLLYGLRYHMKDPIHVLRLASQMSRKHILIETQLLSYDISGKFEDGQYHNLRPVEGVFGLTPNYAARREGGSTIIALVPSLNALLFLIRNFGFSDIQVLSSELGDYEQLFLGHARHRLRAETLSDARSGRDSRPVIHHRTETISTSWSATVTASPACLPVSARASGET